MATPKVFVSYARQDQALAQDILRVLRPMNVDVWSDEQLVAGENWKESLLDQIKQSTHFVLVVSPHTFSSPWAFQELGAAWALNKSIIPVVTDPRLLKSLPIELQATQAISPDELDKLDGALNAA